MSRQARSAPARLTSVQDGGPGATVSVQAHACGEIAERLDILRGRALEFDLRLLSSLLEMALIEAGRIIRRAEMMATKLSTVPVDNPRALAGSFKASTRTRAAGEIADALVVLRARAQEFDMKFLSYLIEMAYIEAFEQSQKEDAAS
jgi:hypothetical protein